MEDTSTTTTARCSACDRRFPLSVYDAQLQEPDTYGIRCLRCRKSKFKKETDQK